MSMHSAPRDAGAGWLAGLPGQTIIPRASYCSPPVLHC